MIFSDDVFVYHNSTDWLLQFYCSHQKLDNLIENSIYLIITDSVSVFRYLHTRVMPVLTLCNLYGKVASLKFSENWDIF